MSTRADDAILVRMSKAQKAALKEEAAGHGISVQSLARWRLFGIADPPPGRPGRVPRRQEELPMTG